MSRNTLIGIAWVVGYASLLAGCLGLAAFTSPVVKQYLPVGIAAMGCFLPFLIVYTITFFKRPFLSPRSFRICLVIAMGWFAGLTLTAEWLGYYGYLPPDGPAYARNLSRLLMHLGWLSFGPLIRLYLIMGSSESKPRA